ncbi:ATP synthase F1 subunit gamma [Ktedonobacter racemifer]|uniref:ATP synthase gamma chain n=1 Tax=Ktedonobacter racemifer DSM 44963 TaxID=485913 RepID=D6TN26_KTERA|nr:ATP synthase F1 subunit gamma [Ktedonobacter racemifer]EFH87176.1 ATP synthase F1, gamma subunit [Ktedonobacter racemifer DSM 44963]
MASIREIGQRIRSIKNIAQITKAMQMVASSKMRRAQDRVTQARPYADQLRELVSRLAAVGSEDLGDEVALLKQRPVRKIGYIVISPDRGLSGALPSNVNRKLAASVLEEQQRLAENGQRPAVDYVAVGRKGRDFVVRTKQNMVAEFVNLGDRPSMGDARAIAQVAVESFLNGDVDVVYMVYPKFINTVTQQPTTVQLLPVQPPTSEEGAKAEKQDYIYEPNPQEIFKALLPRYVDTLVYQALLEMVASQYSAQMIAMKNATDSANDLIQDLSLTYNKARQAAITTQILEVVAGSEAV